MKMFENVPARYLKNTENWILNHNKMNKKLPPIKKLNLIHSNKKYNLNYKNKTLENKNNNNNNNNNESLFEKYYVKMLKKNIHSNSQENLFYSQPIINNINSNTKKNKNYLPPIINIF
jgi:DNA mismatch repair ATPase MutL